MKRLNEIFENKEHKELSDEKDKLNMNWHDFILFLFKFYKENMKGGNK